MLFTKETDHMVTQLLAQTVAEPLQHTNTDEVRWAMCQTHPSKVPDGIHN